MSVCVNLGDSAVMAAGQEYLMNFNFCIFQLLIWKNRVYKFIKSKLSAEDPKCKISGGV